VSELSSEELWRELHDALFKFIRGRVADDATADDLLQDTFLRVHTNLDRLADDTRVAPWVFRIARNRIADHHRQRATHATVAEQDVAAEEPEPTVAENQLVGTWLAAMIDSLPEHYRDALRLVELEGLSQTEAASRLGLSVSGAKSRVQRGREKLRDTLDACCRVEFDRRGNVLDIEPRPRCC